MKRTPGVVLRIVVFAFTLGACAHIHDHRTVDGYSRIAITGPANGAQVSAGSLAIEGTSTERRVEIEVFDPYDRLVTSARLRVHDGRWATRFNVREGRYRIRATPGSDRDADEVRIVYRDEDLRERIAWSQGGGLFREP